MSGGRATFHQRSGTQIRQAGDICAVSEEGLPLTNRWFIECKNVKNISLRGFLFANTGALAKFWKVAQAQAKSHGRLPMLIVRSFGAALVIAKPFTLVRYANPKVTSHDRNCDIYLLTDITKSPYT